MESPDQAVEAAAPKSESSATDWGRRNVIAWTLVAILILVAAAVWGFLQIAEALAPFIMGGFIAFLVRPIINAFQKRMSRGWAVAVTFLLVVAVGILAIALLVPLFVTNAEQFIQNIPTYVQQAQASATQIVSATSAIPQSVKKAMDAAAGQAAATLQAAAMSLAKFILAAGGAALGFGFNMFLGLIIAIWLMLDAPAVSKWSVSILPPSWRADAIEIGTAFDTSFGGFIRGTVINVTITFILCAIGFLLIGLPYSWFLAALVGILDVIPFIGPFIGGAVCTIVGLTVSPTLAILTLIVVIIAEQLVDSVISPIVMGKTVSLNPLGILLSLSIGGAIAGLFGVIIAIPTAAAMYTVYLYFMRKNGVLEPTMALAEEPEGPKKRRWFGSRGKK